MTSADDVAVMTSPRVNVSKRNLTHDSTWMHVGAREGSWQRVEARGARELLRRIFWQRMRVRGRSNDG